MQNRQTNIFQRANAIETQLNTLSQRMNDIKRIQTNITDSHLNIERKLKQINDLSSTINADEKQERLILAQVDQFNSKITHFLYIYRLYWKC
jgi:regulator of replication initiation timing